MDGAKDWFINVVLLKMGPSAVRGAVLGLSGWLITKDGLLNSFGILSDGKLHTTTIYWDRVSIGLITLLPAAIAALIKLLNHQASQAIPRADVPKAP